ncbi:phosphoenolpyruvate mutase [Candidatus Dependentiae bacterium]|nr:phosphoenolpyruvate mutase [Candidatus Dependentiae bacterium]
MTKTQQFKALLLSDQLEFLLEAHNGISAKIVQHAGFKGIWASSLTLSASWCVRDSNELSWTQIVDMLELMNDAADIPILMDGDTGYGNFNTVRRLVKHLERSGIAALCIEDKVFPKNNSFQNNTRHELVSVSEFCGKIRAAKDAQVDSYFSLIARTEGFIAGISLTEVLDRACAYEEAGADAIVVHSKRSDCKEIDNFMSMWQGTVPIIIIPTKYYTTEINHFRQLGIQMVIWANQMLRGTVSHLEYLAHSIYSQESVVSIESTIASLSSIFTYQNVSELEEAEKKYLG